MLYFQQDIRLYGYELGSLLIYSVHNSCHEVTACDSVPCLGWKVLTAAA